MLNDFMRSCIMRNDIVRNVLCNMALCEKKFGIMSPDRGKGPTGVATPSIIFFAHNAIFHNTLRTMIYSPIQLRTKSFSTNIFNNEYVGAYVTWRTCVALHACGAPRERCCSRARLMQPRALAAPVSDVRVARCAPLLGCVLVSIATTRTVLSALSI